MRDIPTCTIDPEDAKDHDDALSIVLHRDGGFELGVHIADVSHFIAYDSVIDKKAQEKATSVYLVEGVHHMLPRELSEDVCSLVPHKDRLCFSVIYTVSPSGEITHSRFAKTLIRSDARFSYQHVEKVLHDKKGAFAPELVRLYACTRAWRDKRLQAGAIEFESEEVAVVRDSKGFPIKITTKPQLESMMLIEECMLLANKTVAEYIEKHTRHGAGIGVYRVHDGPHGEKKAFLLTMLRELGKQVRTEKGKIPQSELKHVLKTSTLGEREFLRLILLRSMGKAYYTSENSGHYGLGLKSYTHFTSPIRRYPDIMVHRILNALLTKRPLPRRELRHYVKLCTHATEMEIAAQEAERDSIKNMQVLYMSTKIGKRWEGIITGIVPYGIFVREHATKSEGFIHARTFSNEFLHHDAVKHELSSSTKTYKLGDEVAIVTESVDPDKGFINYRFA